MRDATSTRFSFRFNSARQVRTCSLRKAILFLKGYLLPCSQTFGLQLGQALSLIGLDEDNRVCRVELSPATPRLATG